MTREDILQEVLELKGNNYLLELATGVGKSRLAIELIKKLSDNKGNLLIVVPRNVHKTNWQEEIIKWWSDCQLKLSYTTYVSLPKYAGNWDYVIFDECHHLSDRCREAIDSFNITHSVLCSATVNYNLKNTFELIFKDLVIYKKDLRDVIEDNILPDPKVYLCPIKLNNTIISESIWKNTKAKGKLINCSFAERFQFIRQRTNPVRIMCTEKQYYIDLCNQIEYWKKRHLRSKSPVSKNKWLKLCGDRLKWLSDKKVIYTQQLLKKLDDYRTLTFCNNIEQTELLGKYCINSKNKDAVKYLEKFNKGEINHITACNMLNESMNLSNCRIGIYNNLNSSETIIKQRTGRLLRHKNPVIIIPYFIDTREEELVKTMLEDYNPKLVTTIKHLYEIKL